MENHSSTRLNKFISESGLCSRRQADRYIEEGNVFINGKRAGIGDRVFAGNRVVVNGHALEPREANNLLLIALNKPPGVTSTTELNVRGNIIDYVNHSQRIFPIGRLDKDSQGLIFLTNNGDIVNKILRAGNNHEKEYVVTVNKPITDQFIHSMANGVPMLGGTTKKCVVKQEAAFVFRITLIQGLNRQIRRMCEHFGYEVTKLERVRIMNVNLKGLPVGDWRELTPAEMDGINRMIEDSSSEDRTLERWNTRSSPQTDGNRKKKNQEYGKVKKSPARKYSKGRKSSDTTGRRSEGKRRRSSVPTGRRRRGR
jgi:23S rRNA pseudouridine2604 synthase